MNRRTGLKVFLLVFAVYLEIIYRLWPSAEDISPPRQRLMSDVPAATNRTTIPPPIPQKVYIFPQRHRKDRLGELQHFIRNGVKSSSRLEETHSIRNQDAVWVVDTVRYQCSLLVDLVKQRLSHQRQETSAIQPWNIFLLNFADEPHKHSQHYERCISEINQLFQSTRHVHYAIKVHVQRRQMIHSDNWRQDENKTFGNLGQEIQWENETIGTLVNGVVRVLRYGVRHDFVQYIEHIKHTMITNTTTGLNNGSNTGVDIVTMPRSGHVAHFWKVGDEVHDYGHRSVVSEAVLDLVQQHPRLKVFAGLVGERRFTGRNSVQEEYVSALLRYKIVVVSQPDRYEDHYKLMEALACGAMVLTDPMHPLPLNIRDGESVVVYRSMGELKRKILYYLQHEEERINIARRGHQVAMEYHQSAQWMERIVFGDWNTIHGV